MRKLITALATTAVAGATVVVTGGTAMAATVTVTNPGGTGAYTATSTAVDLADGSVHMKCTGSTGTGTASSGIKSGTYTVPPTANIGNIDTLNFTNCTGPLGAVTTTVSTLPYHVFLTAKTSTGATGYIGPVNVHLSMPLCSFNVTGNAPGTYVNGTSNQLRLAPGTLPSGVTPLTVSGVSGCAGLVSNGQHPTYTANYTVSPNITVL